MCDSKMSFLSPYIIKGLYNSPWFFCNCFICSDSLSTKLSKLYKGLFFNSFNLFSKISFEIFSLFNIGLFLIINSILKEEREISKTSAILIFKKSGMYLFFKIFIYPFLELQDIKYLFHTLKD